MQHYGDRLNATLTDSARYGYRAAAAEGNARLPYLSHAARFDRMSSRYAVARREGRLQAAAAIKRAANRIVDEMETL